MRSAEMVLLECLQMRMRGVARTALVIFLIGGSLAAYPAGRYLWAVYHGRAAEDALARRDFVQAGLHLAKVLSVRPHDGRARLLAAQAARRQGNFEEALLQLENCAQQPDLAEALALEKKLLRLQQGDFSEAGVLLASCGDGSDSPDRYLMLEALIESGRTALANEAALRLPGEPDAVSPRLERTRSAVALWLRTWPAPMDQAQGLIWRGMIHSYANEKAQAEADWRKALQLDPDNFEARRELAVSIAYACPEEALAHLKLLRKRRPQDKRVCFSLAAVHRGLGQLDEAGQLLDELLRADPQDVYYLVERGYVAMNAGQAQDAERWLRKAMELAPDAPFVNLAMSGCLNLAGRPAEAKVYFDRGKMLEDAQRLKAETMVRQRKAAGGAGK